MTKSKKLKVPPQVIRTTRAVRAPQKALYWAYGSNLNLAHMARRCPQAEPVGPLNLLHGQLIFRGVADVTVKKDSEVPGGLWRITRRCEHSLDAYEGVSSRLYLKRFFTVQDEETGQLEDVLFYQMQTKRGRMPPSQHYLQTIVDGYEDFGLDRRFLDEALQDSWEQKEVTRHLRERHDRRGRPSLAESLPLPTPFITGEFVLTDDELKEAGAS